MKDSSLQLEDLPRTVEAFTALRNQLATTPFGGAAMFAIALEVYCQDPAAGIPLLTIAIDQSQLCEGVEGIAGKQPTGLRYFKTRNLPQPWIARSVFQGTSPEGSYALPPFPLTIKFREQVGDMREDDAKIFIYTTGADNPKPMRLKKNDKGLWKAVEWSSFQGNCRPPKPVQSDDL